MTIKKECWWKLAKIELTKELAEEILRKWYGRNRSSKFSDWHIFEELGKTYPTRPPSVLYRGVTTSEKQSNFDFTNDSKILDLARGKRSWSRAISYARFYAEGGATPNSANFLFVWESPNSIILSGDKINQIAKTKGMTLDVFDSGEYIAELPSSAKIVSKKRDKYYTIVTIR